MTPILTAHGVQKSFPVSRSDREQVRVLRKVDLEVAAGEFVAIVGRSGSGKSTLLYCLSGLVPVDAGTIVLAGRHIDSASRTERARLRRDHVGFVFQDLNLLAALTVRDNVALPAKLAHTGANRQDVAAALDQVGLGGKARAAYPDELSGGEQQRVAIARAILRRPSTLFADEPTGSLDVDNHRHGHDPAPRGHRPRHGTDHGHPRFGHRSQREPRHHPRSRHRPHRAAPAHTRADLRRPARH